MWILGCWHFGRDSITFEASGNVFNMTAAEVNAVLRAYLKRMSDKRFVRFERIERPKENLASFLSRKLEEG